MAESQTQRTQNRAPRAGEFESLFRHSDTRRISRNLHGTNAIAGFSMKLNLREPDGFAYFATHRDGRRGYGCGRWDRIIARNSHGGFLKEMRGGTARDAAFGQKRCGWPGHAHASSITEAHGRLSKRRSAVYRSHGMVQGFRGWRGEVCAASAPRWERGSNVTSWITANVTGHGRAHRRANRLCT